MSNIDKPALREAANAANETSWGLWESYHPHKGARGYEVKVGVKAIAQHCLKVDSVFIAAANPATVLALLDELEAAENNLIDSECHVAELEESLRDKQALLEAAEKRIAELEERAFNPAILDVIAERQRQRQRQQSVEGWTPEHDDEHGRGEMAMAAVCYINETGTVNRNGGRPWGWPWDASWWKPNTRRRNLVKAGALIIAEIERIDRAAGIGKGE